MQRSRFFLVGLFQFCFYGELVICVPFFKKKKITQPLPPPRQSKNRRDLFCFFVTPPEIFSFHVPVCMCVSGMIGSFENRKSIFFIPFALFQQQTQKGMEKIDLIFGAADHPWCVYIQKKFFLSIFIRQKMLDYPIKNLSTRSVSETVKPTPSLPWYDS